MPDGHPRRTSPQWTPRPLRPSPWNLPRNPPRSISSADTPPDTSTISPLYCTKIQRPVQEPNELLHDFYNVAQVPFRFEADGSVPQSVEMPLVRRTDTRPTHALAVLSSLSQLTNPSPAPSPTARGLSARSASPSSLSPISSPSTPSSPYSPVYSEPLLLPIDAPLFAARFGHDAARSLGGVPPVKHSPVLRWDHTRGIHLVTLPLIPLYVPHPPSIPHLLLFGQGLPSASNHTPPPPSPLDIPNYSRPSPPRYMHSSLSSPNPSLPSRPSPSTLAAYLLPISTIEEFPSAPAMAAEMARRCSHDTLHAYSVFNQGLWRNVLLLAPIDISLVDVVRVAWSVTAEARRIRGRCLDEEGEGEDEPGRQPPASPRSLGAEPLPSVNVQYVEAGGIIDAHPIHLEPVPTGRKPGRRRSSKNLTLKNV